jgi:magnesium-transporting ATPase (P-type)
MVKKKTSRKKSSKKKKNSKFEYSNLLNTILKTLENFVVPKIFSEIKEKFHHEIHYISNHFENKFRKVTKQTLHELINLFVFLFGFALFSFGIFYLFTDIFNMPRAYVLLGLGFIMFIIVLLTKKRVHY